MKFQIYKLKNHWFSELKCGLDKRYLFDIGKLEEGVFYFSDELRPKTEALHEQGLLTRHEYRTVTGIMDNTETGDDLDYDMIFELFRKRYVIRWGLHEVLAGKKLLPNKIMKLKNAIYDQTACKIDMIIYNGEKFMEVTNFIVISYKGKPINIGGDEITPANLPIEIEKLYYSDMHYKPFKMVKRAFAYLKWLHGNAPRKVKQDMVLRGAYSGMIDKNIMKYVNILKKSINILYTINSEIDAMRIIDDRVPAAMIRKRLNELKGPLANVLEINDDMMDEITEAMDSEFPDLNDIYASFNRIINCWTIMYFANEGINPPPKLILPQTMSYDPNLIREVGYF